MTSYTVENGSILESRNTPASIIQAPKKEWKWLSSIQKLIYVQFGLAILLIILEAILDIMGAYMNLPTQHKPFICASGAGIVAGILGTITAGLGFKVFRWGSGKNFILAYFVMCIICAIGDILLIVVAGACVHGISSRIRNSNESTNDMVAKLTWMLAVECLILIIALAHFISSIVSTSFICGNWCRGNQSNVAMVYSTENGTAKQENVTLIQNGDQMILPLSYQPVTQTDF